MIELTSAQQEALAEIRQACSVGYRDDPKVIVVQGFSGGYRALGDEVENTFPSEKRMPRRSCKH